MATRLSADGAVTLKMDGLGRILIPQGIRERLGLRAGTTLKLVHENEKAIFLEPVREEPRISYEKGWPVFVTPRRVGHGETKKLMREMYEERAAHHAGHPPGEAGA